MTRAEENALEAEAEACQMQADAQRRDLYVAGLQSEVLILKSQVQKLKDTIAMCIRPMERCGLQATADECRRVLFPELHQGTSPLAKKEVGQ